MLTICLITKGRLQHLRESLMGLDRALAHDSVQIIIFDNGSGKECQQILQSWATHRKSRVEYIRQNHNDVRQNGFLNLLKSKGIGWVVFPGDDDIFEPDSILEWRKLVSENPNLDAICFSAKVLDKYGKVVETKLRPSLNLNDTYLEQVARSFHEPPFIWPCLFFNLSKIDFLIPSRFVFDWSIGLNILINGKFSISEFASLGYRRHESQESNLGALRQKIFEATFWMTEFIESKYFVDFVRQLTLEEKKLIWKLSIDSIPIYGNQDFALQVLFALKSTLLDEYYDSDMAGIMAIDLAKCMTVVVPANRAINFTNLELSPELKFDSSPHLEFLNDVCAPIAKLSLNFTQNKSNAPIRVGCQHSVSNLEFVKFDCRIFGNRSQEEHLDIFVIQLTHIMEKQNAMSFVISGRERRLIEVSRNLKRYLPKGALRKLKSVLIK